MTQAAAKHSEDQILQNNGWKCNRCGRVNPNYTGTCGCGISRAESEKWLPEPIKEDSEDDIQKLKSYKELLDTGVITQEEFDKKKKELLGL